MGVLLYLHTDSSYQELENIQDLKITQVMNDHGYLFLSAVVQEDAKTKYATEVKAYEMVEIVVGEIGKYDTIFKGVVKNVEVRLIQKVYYLFVSAATGSYKMDLEKRSRSFQNKEMAYKDMITQIMSEYNGGEFIDMALEGAALKKLIVQYKETDWEFVKRMASRFQAAVVPSLINDTPKIVMGKPQGTNRGEIEKYNFYITKDLERFMIASKNKNCKMTQLDVVTFYIETTDHFEIGDGLTYFDRASNKTYSNVFIKSKEIEMVEGALRFRYSLCLKNGFETNKIYNEKIAGVSLKGKVMERIQDTIKVSLEIDEGLNTSTDWQFQYTTPYTAEGSGGWYVMPEVDDIVFIYFPDKEESNAVGMNSVRDKNTGTDKIGSPEIKYLRTADGKELKLAPDELMLTCSNWVNKKTGEVNKIYIQLKDAEGIIIQSTKPININSDADINFTADKKILIMAEDEIKLRCKSSQIKMDAAMEVISSSVKVN